MWKSIITERLELGGGSAGGEGGRGGEYIHEFYLRLEPLIFFPFDRQVSDNPDLFKHDDGAADLRRVYKPAALFTPWFPHRHNHCPSSPPRCYLLDGISKGAWLNRSSIIFAGNDRWSADPRVSIVSNIADKHEYSLQIQRVDVSDDGQYTCSIQSERNPRPKLLNLIVKGSYLDLLDLFCLSMSLLCSSVLLSCG